MKLSLKNWLAIALTLCAFVSGAVSAQSQIQGPTASSADVLSGVVYGPIDESDTLWRIASRYNEGKGFHVYQTMLAIYELNPQAFENGNFNTMVNGATLQLPSDPFIARMDINEGRAKAQADDRAIGRVNSGQPQSVFDEFKSTSNAPQVPLVNQADLSSTQKALQQQLDSLNSQQNYHFNEVRSQVSMSINNVQNLINENRRLYERLDQVNQDVAELRVKIEVDIQTQIDQQLILQKEIIDLMKPSEPEEVEEKSSSIWSVLKSPTAIITLSSILTIGMLGLLAMLILHKPKSEVDLEDLEEQSNEPIEIIDDELVIGEADDEADDLLAALSQDEDDKDDVLSSELEDGLDELGVGENIDDSMLDEVDDMLVPDTDDFDEDAAALNTANIAGDAPDLTDEIDENVSFNAEAIDLDADELENQEIDLSPKSKDAASADASPEETTQEEATQEEAIPDEGAVNSATTADGSGIDSEVSNSDANSEVDDSVPASNNLTASADESDIELPDTNSESIDEASLQKMEDSINEVTEEFDNLSNEIMDEFEAGENEELASASDNNEVELEVKQASDTETDTLESDAVDDQELDELLDQFSELPNDDIDAQQAIETTDASDDTLDTTTELADELASELSPDEVDGELDSLIDELGDSDSLLDEIPSFNEITDINDSDDISEGTEANVDALASDAASEATISKQPDSSDDALSDLPDLDDWLNEESAGEGDVLDSNAADHDSELDALADIEGTDFDDLLAEIDEEDGDAAGELEALENEISQEESANVLEEAGLDIDTLMSEEAIQDDESNEFVDVDDLLSETETLTPKGDDELELDLDSSLSRMGENESVTDTTSQSNTDTDDSGAHGDDTGNNAALAVQASNLDLAQVYIDMDEKEAAIELLEEVLTNGNEKQVAEATELLNGIR